MDWPAPPYSYVIIGTCVTVDQATQTDVHKDSFQGNYCELVIGNVITYTYIEGSNSATNEKRQEFVKVNLDYIYI